MAPSQRRPDSKSEDDGGDSVVAYSCTLDDGTTIIGTDLILDGDLTVEGDLIVYGSLGGTVHGRVRHVSVEPSGKLTATVRSESLDVSGELGGQAESETDVLIHRTARIRGEHSAPKFIVEDFRCLDHASLSGTIVPVDEEQDEEQKDNP